MRKILLGLALLGACGTDIEPIAPDATATAKVTWYQDVAPVVSKHCMSCHQDGGIAPFALTDYDSARMNAQRMLDQIDQGAMPPFGAREESDCTPRFGWVDDPRLSATEKQLLHDWLDQGARDGHGRRRPAAAEHRRCPASRRRSSRRPASRRAAIATSSSATCSIRSRPARGSPACRCAPASPRSFTTSCSPRCSPARAQDALVAAHPDRPAVRLQHDHAARRSRRQHLDARQPADGDARPTSRCRCSRARSS